MKSVSMDRTKLYEQFHSFEKYHNSWYNRMHEMVRTFIRRVIPSNRKTAY